MTTVKQSVNDQFSNVAANYRTSVVHATGRGLQLLGELAAELDAPTVLDLGCGAGHASAAVAPASAKVVAYDLSEEMLAQVRLVAAERGFDHIETRQGDVENLPFEDASFDLIVSRYSAHHWPNPLAALRECRRVLKPGGKLYMNDIVSPETPAADSFLQTLEVLRDKSHVRDHSVSQWQTMIAQAGFAPQLVEEWRMDITFDKWVTRMETPQAKVDVIRTMFAEAPHEIRHTFQLQENDNFQFHCALLAGT